MESPNTARGVRAFCGASTATVASSVDDTPAAHRARKSDVRFYWDRYSNSVQPLTLYCGRVWHE